MGFWCSLLVEVLGGVVTASLLAALAAFWNADNQIDAHDREVRSLDEDLRRFLRDRDRLLRVELEGIRTNMAGRGLLYSGAALGGLADAKRQALQDYRDEITWKRRLYREACERERWATRVLRRRRGAFPRFELPDESKAILAAWREDVTISGMDGSAPVDDPTSPEREPDLRRFENEGDDCS